MSCIKTINERLGDGDRVEITRAEWLELCAFWQAISDRSSEAYALRKELERLQRISRPVWRAARRVKDQMERAISTAARADAHVAISKVRDWRIDLDCALRVDIRDLPAGHPAHSEFRR